MGIDILGIDIMGVDILGIDIVALPHLKVRFFFFFFSGNLMFPFSSFQTLIFKKKQTKTFLDIYCMISDLHFCIAV